MSKHITRILELVHKLSAIAKTINDSHITALFLRLLPLSYDTLITALEARLEEELSSDLIWSKLMDEYNSGIENTESSDTLRKLLKHKENSQTQITKKTVNTTYIAEWGAKFVRYNLNCFCRNSASSSGNCSAGCSVYHVLDIYGQFFSWSATHTIPHTT